MSIDAKKAKFLSMSARVEHKLKAAAERAGKGIHDRPSKIPLAPLGKRDGLLRHPCLLANPRLCQPGHLAGRPQVLPELPENPVRIRISGYPPSRHLASIF